MRKSLVVISIAATLFPAANTYAFGLGDIVNIGIQAGGKLIGAAVDKATDAVKESMRDPEAEAREKAEQERKLAEQIQKQIDKIEATPGLRPIDRERLVLQIQEQYQAVKEMQAFIARAEARQKEERDKLFTVGGIAGVVGEAAMSSPSMVMARANAMAHDPAWRAQMRANNQAAFRQASAMVAAGEPRAKARVVLAQADALTKTGAPQAGAQAIVDNAEALKKAQEAAKDAALAAAEAEEKGEIHAATDETTAISSIDGERAARASSKGKTDDVKQGGSLDAFSPDLGKKIWIEFEDAPSETAMLRKLLESRSHVLASAKEEADVVYLIQGEFIIPESKVHEGLTKSLGDLLEKPGQTIDPPAKKAMGAFQTGLASFMLAAAGAKPPVETKGYTQQALLVIARQPKDGKETRASVLRKERGEDIMGGRLAKSAREELYRLLGV